MMYRKIAVALACLTCCSISFGAISGPVSSKQIYRKATAQREQDQKKYDLTVVGSVDMASGVNKQSVELIDSLKEHLQISFVLKGKKNVAGISKPVQNILTISGVKHKGRVLIYESFISYPPLDRIDRSNFWAPYGLEEEDENQVRLAYSMFETTEAPKNWVYILNRFFDAVLVPDEFLVKVYKDSGVSIPVFVVPLGVDLSRFLSAPIKKVRKSPMVFANFSSCTPRKNLLTLVQGFAKAFGDNPHVKLKLRFRKTFHPCYDAIRSASRGLHNVDLEEKKVGQDTYIRQFLDVDCYVNVAKGEGFSIQPREAMALGIPVIVANNTAQKTICSSGLVRSVPSDNKIPAKYTFPGNYGYWFGCTVQDVAQAFRDVYEHYDHYLQNAERARQWASQYDYPQLRSMYLNVIKPKKIILGTEDKVLEDGIMTTSKKLAEKYERVWR